MSFLCLLVFLGFINLNIEVLNISNSLTARDIIWFSTTVNFKYFFSFDLTELTYIIVFVVFFISALVHLYSIEYMYYDPKKEKFLFLLFIFTGFMDLLILSQNFLLFFLSWEGVGICSYLLISFWQSRVQAIKSALKAVLINKVGDIFLLFGILLLYNELGKVTFDALELLSLKITPQSTRLFNLIGFCFIVGAFTKSAQFLLHTWLPDAMEGPTPVSALIHAATMVAAGVFLILRIAPILLQSPFLMNLILIIGSITTIFAARMAIMQRDLKKIIAYSTCSQLGYMFMVSGLGYFSFALFHLLMHAFYKALLFLCAGSVIHALSDEQDIRKMGGLYKVLPITYISMLIGNLALLGFPFFSGFFSKDFILYLLTLDNIFVSFGYFCGIIGSLYTANYSIFIFKYVFFGGQKKYGTNINYSLFHNVRESSWRINIVLIILAVCSICFGFFLKDYFIVLETLPKNIFVGKVI